MKKSFMSARTRPRSMLSGTPGRSRYSSHSARPQKQRRQVSQIHHSKFVRKAKEIVEETPYIATHQFKDFALDAVIQKSLGAAGFVSPSPIQDQAIPPALDGCDVLGLANTGTGKTAAFLLPIIQKLLHTKRRDSVLILAPTRELAQQINAEFRRFTPGLGLYSTVLVGGVNINPQIKDLRRHPHVIIGTPGRTKDLLNQRELSLASVDTFVLDEADRMLDMGFIRDIRFIAERVPATRQTLCFSATITPEVEKLIDDFMSHPVKVSVRTADTSDNVDQDVIFHGDKNEKVDMLHEMLGFDGFDRVLVFANTKFGSQRLADTLSKKGVPSVAIHGNKSQGQRQRALNDFKQGKVNVLVATDVAARGLDIPDVSHVINFDPPIQYEDYVHRIGRTGRAGKKGKALTFVEKRTAN